MQLNGIVAPEIGNFEIEEALWSSPLHKEMAHEMWPVQLCGLSYYVSMSLK